MDSPLEAITGEFDHAIFTTFTFDPIFFDHWVMPLLARSGVRNVIVMVDARQLATAIANSNPTRAGRAYHVAAMRSPGAFHPKLIALLGRHHSRIVVSSANLTTSGQLRNLEAAVVLDDTEPTHRSAIDGALTFLRRLGDPQPAHVVEALHAALPSDRDSTPSERAHFVHNLDSPIASQLPGGSITAVAPFIDSSGAAARYLQERHGLTFIPDANHLAAPEAVLSDLWEVVPVSFLGESSTRQLHGKAYWSEGGEWVLVGSPNLTAPALLQTARHGNTEAAVLLSGQAFELPDHEDVPLASLLAAATQRWNERESAIPEDDSTTCFNAEFDEGNLHVDLPDDMAVDSATTFGWERLGLVQGGQVLLPDDQTPVRLRAQMADGMTAFAIVHYPSSLRAARTRRAQTRATDAIAVPPLDIQGINDLRQVLLDLYTLDELATEAAQNVAVPRPRPTVEPSTTSSIGQWRPAHASDGPRIPDLYYRRWHGDPDALLALVQHALRLDELTDDQRLDEYEDTAAADREAGQTDEPHSGARPARRTTREVLGRYASSILRLLERGTERVRDAADPTVADLTFHAVLRFYEKLTDTIVGVPTDADPERFEDVPLVDRTRLRLPKLDLLEAYCTTRDWHDLLARRTMLTHLAECVAFRFQLAAKDQRRLDTLCDLVAAELIQDEVLQGLPTSGQFMGTREAVSALWGYTTRHGLEDVIEYAESFLDDCDFVAGSELVIEGECEIADLRRSPAWTIVGFGARASYDTHTPISVVVTNANNRHQMMKHAVTVDPTSGEIEEAFQRRSDRQWQWRHASAGADATGSLEDHAGIVIGRLVWSSYTDAGTADRPLPTDSATHG